jgi:hypothetical protein
MGRETNYRIFWRINTTSALSSAILFFLSFLFVANRVVVKIGIGYLWISGHTVREDVECNDSRPNGGTGGAGEHPGDAISAAPTNLRWPGCPRSTLGRASTIGGNQHQHHLGSHHGSGSRGSDFSVCTDLTRELKIELTSQVEYQVT